MPKQLPTHCPRCGRTFDESDAYRKECVGGICWCCYNEVLYEEEEREDWEDA